MNAKLKKTWNIISTVLVAVVVILALLLAGARLLGMQVFTVLSGSMEPTYHTGTITCTNKLENNYWLNGFSQVVKNIFGISH